MLEVVQQIRAWQQVQGAQQPFAERHIEDVFHGIRRQRTGGNAVQQFSKARLAVDQHVTHEHHMVQAEQVDGEVVFLGQAQHVGEEHLHADWNVAHADKAFEVSVAINRFCHHPGRVSEVDNPRVRADFLNIFNDVENHRNGAQTFKQAARAVSFLTQVTVAQRNTFVFFTGFQLAYAQLGGDKVGVFQRFTAVQRLIDFHRHAGFFHHALAQCVDNIQLLLAAFDVNQPQFRYRQLMIAFKKTFQ